MSFQNCKIVEVNANPAKYLAGNGAKRGDQGLIVSSSTLRTIAQCPSRWLAGYESPDSEAKDYGSLLDLLALTPERFDERYIVRPETYTNKDKETKPWNSNATVCRDWSELQSAAGKEIVRKDAVLEVQAAVAELKADEILNAFVEASDKQVWVTGEWLDEGTGLIIPVQCLVDLVPRRDTEFAKCLGDLKTTRNAGVRVWQRWCATAGYHVQAAFNTDLYMAAINPERNKDGEERNTFCFVVQENYAPFQIARRMLSDLSGIETLFGIGRTFYQSALKKYARCLKTGNWPCYDDTPLAIQGWTPIEAEPWMAFESAAQVMEEQQAEAMAESEDVPS